MGPTWESNVNAYFLQMQLVRGRWVKVYFADIIDAQTVWMFVVDNPTLSVWMTARTVAMNVARRSDHWFLYRLMVAGL